MFDWVLNMPLPEMYLIKVSFGKLGYEAANKFVTSGLPSWDIAYNICSSYQISMLKMFNFIVSTLFQPPVLCVFL